MSLPPSEIPLGAMRFNSDSQKLEYWNGSAWFQIRTFSPNLDGGVRGIYAGGVNTPSGNSSNEIQFFTISTQGDTTDFGDHATATTTKGALSDTIRGLFYGGFSPAITGNYQNTVDQITIATTGNASDFGDNTEANYAMGGTSDSHGGLS